MNEFLTTVDLGRAVALRALTGTRKDLEYRRLRARGTLWMAMALDMRAASTLTLEDECMPFMLKHTDEPASEAWLTLVHHFIKPRIMPAWIVLNLDAKLGGHKLNDTIIAHDAAARGIPVITRDKGVATKAAARGGIAVSPEEFAASVLSFQDARRAFFQRFDAHAPAWALEAAGGDVNAEFTKRQCHWLKSWRIRCEYIWTDEPGRFFLNTDLGELDL